MLAGLLTSRAHRGELKDRFGQRAVVELTSQACLIRFTESDQQVLQWQHGSIIVKEVMQVA